MDENELRQHLSWLRTYVEEMTPDNWRDMKLRAERQLGKIDALARHRSVAVEGN
jgi:hypothetical protein